MGDATAALHAELANLPEDQPGRSWLLNCDDEVLRRFQHQYSSQAKSKLLATASWRVAYGADALTLTWPIDNSLHAKICLLYTSPSPRD